MNFLMLDLNESDGKLLSTITERYFYQLSQYASCKHTSDVKALISEIENNPLSYDAIFCTESIWADGTLHTELQNLGYKGLYVIVRDEHKEKQPETNNSIAYVLDKPYSDSEICDCCNILSGKFSNASIMMSVNNKSMKVELNDIMYIKDNKSGCSLHLSNGEIIENSRNLADTIKEMESGLFIRTDENCIVNMRYIKQNNTDSFQLYNGQNIPIAKQNSDNIVNEYQAYIEKTSNLVTI